MPSINGNDEGFSRTPGTPIGATLRPSAAQAQRSEAERKSAAPAVRPGHYVVRTWFRDGSQNVMDLDRAADSLVQFYPTMSRGQIKAALTQGQEFRTGRATFRLYRRGDLLKTA